MAQTKCVIDFYETPNILLQYWYRDLTCFLLPARPAAFGFKPRREPARNGAIWSGRFGYRATYVNSGEKGAGIAISREFLPLLEEFAKEFYQAWWWNMGNPPLLSTVLETVSPLLWHLVNIMGRGKASFLSGPIPRGVSRGSNANIWVILRCCSRHHGQDLLVVAGVDRSLAWTVGG